MNRNDSSRGYDKDMANENAARRGPLSGLRVLELGHFIAAPFCTRLLADLGAEVIKAEPPGDGDPVRTWGEMIDGHTAWWSAHGRNKKCITLNLKHEKGLALARSLIAKSDIVVENFRPGQMERFGLDVDTLKKVRPGLILVRISGYGQTGPDSQKSSFGAIGEAVGGIRYLTGYPPGEADLPPVRTGISFGDSMSGMYGALGALAAVIEQRVAGVEWPIRVIDVALTESVLSLLEGIMPEYSVMGKIRQPAGSGLPGAAPSSAYPVDDGQFILIGANSEPLFARLCKIMGRPDLTANPKFADNPSRVANVRELDAIIGAWTSTLSREDALHQLEQADIPASKIYTAADIADDPQYRARGALVAVDDPFFDKPVLQPATMPRFDAAAPGGAIEWPGPDVGSFNDEVYAELMGLSETEREQLRKEGVI